MGILSQDFPHLLGNAPGMVHSPQVHMLAGDWDMSTPPEPSVPVAVAQGVLSTAGSLFRMTPNSHLVGNAFSCYAVTRDGIATSGGVTTDVGKIVMPAAGVGDNLLFFGAALVNTSAPPEDFITLMRGGVPSVPVWGAYVQFSPTGFSSFPIVNSNVGVAVSDTFDTVPVVGDSLYYGLHRPTGALSVQHHNATAKVGAALDLTGLPEDETFYQMVFLVFSSSNVVFSAGYLQFDPGNNDLGRTPFQGNGEAIPPVGATDGREYHVPVGGSYRTYRTLPGDFVKFFNNLNDLQITRLPSRFTTPVYTVQSMAYDQNDDILRLELSNGVFLETPIPTDPGLVSASFDENTDTLTLTLADGSVVEVIIPAGGGVTGMSFDDNTRTLTLTQQGGDPITVVITDSPGVTAMSFEGDQLSLTLSNDTILTATIPAVSGFVAITDIQPTNSLDNVFNKVTTDGGQVLQSCESSTSAITVHVVAVTGKNSFRPGVLINGVPVTNLARNFGSDTWAGSAAITLVGATVTATHSEGATDTAIVTVSAPPVVTSASFSNLYPNPGQTEHAAGQTFTLSVSADQPFVNLEVVDDGGTATLAVTGPDFTATSTKSVTVTAANRGNSPQALSGKVRVKNQNGTWSAVVSTANLVTLNNTQPTAALGAIVYDNGFQALKGTETASVAFSWTNADTVSFTSPNAQLQVTDPGVLEPSKTVARITGGYNISTNNLQAVVGRTANATSFTVQKVVWIADTPAQVSVANTLPVRLQSGPTGNIPAYPVTLTSNQRLLTGVNAPTLVASIGSWAGAGWATADSGATWTRSLSIHDADAKGPGTFSNLVCRNLAGIVTGVLTSGGGYTVGGFIRRVVSFPAGASPSREAAIGTTVVTASLVKATNLSKGVSGTFNVSYSPSPTLVDDAPAGPFTFSITGPSGVVNPVGYLVYNNDSINAANNINPLVPVQFEIEEVAS